MIEKKSKPKKSGWYLRVDIWGPGLLILISVGVAIAFVVIASQGKTTPLENIMFQLFSLSTGIIASFILGKRTAKQAAKDLIKPHARSAFRRSMFLYQSLSRLATAIEQGKQQETSGANKNMVLEKLEAIVVEQIATADDALEDWKDIVPEDVEELLRRVDKVGNNNE